jgi:hypothetical protein
MFLQFRTSCIDFSMAFSWIRDLRSERYNEKQRVFLLHPTNLLPLPWPAEIDEDVLYH